MCYNLILQNNINVIDGKNIGTCYPPYIIAELSANHNGSLELEKKTIIEAIKSCASAIKLQTYNANSMTINSSKEDFIIKDLKTIKEFPYIKKIFLFFLKILQKNMM